MGDVLKKILDLSYKFGYLKSSVAMNSLEYLSFGPLAMLLASNIRNEWFQSNVVNTDLNTFLYSSHTDHQWQEDCQTSFSHSLKLANDQLPFGLASVLSNFKDFDNRNEENIHNSSQKTNLYRRLVFIDPKDSKQYFYRLQHQRKIWWRKFSTDPETFCIVEDKSDKNKENVQISARFPWSTEIVEIINNHGDFPLTAYGSLFEVKVGRKKLLPHVIESVCLERPAVVTYLYDAYQQLPGRTMLRLHFSLAPYKTAVAVDPTDTADKVEELNQLATYLSLNLRKAGLHTLFSVGGKSKKALEYQLSIHDSLGIPYTVVVTVEALTNGIVGLRSRDTTLQEQVHVNNLTPYLKQLLAK